MTKMIRIPVTISLPVDDIAQAIAPSVARANKEALKSERQLLRMKPPVVALVEAADAVAKAVTRHENSVGTRDEPSATRALVVAAIGIRSAVAALKNPL